MHFFSSRYLCTTGRKARQFFLCLLIMVTAAAPQKGFLQGSRTGAVFLFLGMQLKPPFLSARSQYANMDRLKLNFFQ